MDRILATVTCQVLVAELVELRGKQAVIARRIETVQQAILNLPAEGEESDKDF